MRENEPALLVLSTYDGKLFLRKVKFYLRNVNYPYLSSGDTLWFKRIEDTLW